MVEFVGIVGIVLGLTALQLSYRIKRLKAEHQLEIDVIVGRCYQLYGDIFDIRKPLRCR